jgi:hypothetical protein
MFQKILINHMVGMPLGVFGANRRMSSGDTTASSSTGDYENGSDILLQVGDSCIARCSTHNVQYNTETKERAVKAPASESKQSALFTSKGVTKLTITAHGEAFRFYQATENGFEECAALWGKGQAVELSAFKRGNSSSPYLKGKFVITAMEETNPANDDATWTIDLENSGEPDIYPGKAASA